MAKNPASSFHDIPIELTNTQDSKITGIEEVYQEDYWGHAWNELREKARMPRSEERVPTLKGGDEWPYGFEHR